MPNTSNDLTGMRFGKLTVLERTPERINRRIVYKCVCDCGRVCFMSTQQLRREENKSCGCLKIGKWREAHKKLRETELKEMTNIAFIKQATGYNKDGRKIGVWWDKRQRKWRAGIEFQGKWHSCGSFKNYEDAVKARKEAEEKYFVPILEKYGRI